MACPCCGFRSKLDALEGSVVNIYSRSRKPDHNVMISKRVKASAENRRHRELDAKSQKKLVCSLPSKSHQGNLSTIRCLQRNTSINPNARNFAMRSKVSTSLKNYERRRLAFVLHDEDFTDAPTRPKLSCEYSDKLKPCTSKSFKMHAFQTATSHVSPCPYKGSTTGSKISNNAKIQAANDCSDGKVSDPDVSEESELEVEGAICLTSFTFGSSNHLPPTSESVAGVKRSLVRQLSSESCISMLSLNCTEDQLSIGECAEPSPSDDDSSLQAEMKGISVLFPEVQNNLDDDMSVEKQCFQFGGSDSIGIQLMSSLEMETEAINSSSLSLPPILKSRGTTNGQLEDLKSQRSNKKRLRSANHERYRLRSNKARKASLNRNECRGLAGHCSGGTDIDRALNLGVGIGVSYMLFANWTELKKLNLLLERTESLVKDIQKQAPSMESPLAGCFSNLGTPNHKELENHVETPQPQNVGVDGADEPLLKSINMADLEAALEAELVLMQENLEAEFQASPRGSDEWKQNQLAVASAVQDLTDNPDQAKTSHCSAINNALHRVVSPNTLNKRLHEVLEVQQEERILHLEAQIEARELDLIMKEKELQCWKDIAHHLVNALPAKSAVRTEGCTIDSSRAQQGLSCGKHDARHHLLPLRSEDFNTYGPMHANRAIRDYEFSARSESFCDNLSDSLIDPSFEALTLRNSLDWSVGAFEAQSTEAERKEDSALSNHRDQDVCDVLEGLDVDKMFPWLLCEDEGLGEVSQVCGSSLFASDGLQVDFGNND